MRKTRAHPPANHKTEDLRHYRRVIRDAVGELDVAGAPRWLEGVELTLAGRIRMLASSAAALDRSASSSAAVPASGEEHSTSVGKTAGATAGAPLRRPPSTGRTGAGTEQ